MIEIYLKTNTNYDKNGDITLDPTSCTYKESEKELTLEHFLDEDGRWKYINFENVIAAEENGKKKFYRIYNVVRELYSVTAYARPIFYDLIDKVLLDVRPTNKIGQEALDIILADTGFTGHSNISNLSTAYYVRKNIVEALLGNEENSFLNRWGGEFYCENFDVYINDKIGSDNGVRVEFGYNLNEIEEDVNIEEVVTRIIPVGYDGIMLDGETPWVDSPLINKYTQPKMRVIEFSDVKVKESSDDEEGFDTIEEARAELIRQCNLLYENDIDKPIVNYKIDMINLANTTAYKDFKMLVEVNKGDTVTCYIKHLDIDVKARVIDYERDLITGEYTSIELGNAVSNFFNKQADIQSQVDNILNDNGSVNAGTVEGAINAIKTQFKALKDIAQPQDVRAIIFEDRVEDSPTFGCMCLGTMGFEIASSFKPGTKEWDFKTFGTGQGFYADYIVAGVLNANLIKTGIIMSANGNLALSIDDDYLEVTHSEGNTRTRIDNEGFYILDENNEIIASLASKESWTELKADKVFAKNIENVYIGDSNLYVDHNSNNIIRNGSIDYPFTDFNQLREYVQSMPIINKDLFIYVVTEGVVNDLFYLTGLSGNGKVDIRFNNKFILKTENDYGVVLRNISNWVSVYGGRTSYQSKDGFMIQATNGIEVINCSKFELSSLLTDTSAYGIHVQDSHGKMDNIDFCKAYSALGVRGGQVWLSGSCRGSNTKAVRAFEGTLVTIGENDSNSIRQQGILEEVSGTIKEISTIVETASTVYAPVIPPTINTYKDFSITSMATYQYLWSNWKVGECKSGVYGSYGDKAGHLFFDLSAIRSFLNGGTVLDGATITLTRANSGGSSSGVKIYVGGSSCNGASGTPSYYNKTYVGTLSWGQTNTFSLPKVIVEGIKNGTINSITTHGSGYSNIVSASINLKVNK